MEANQSLFARRLDQVGAVIALMLVGMVLVTCRATKPPYRNEPAWSQDDLSDGRNLQDMGYGQPAGQGTVGAPVNPGMSSPTTQQGGGFGCSGSPTTGLTVVPLPSPVCSQTVAASGCAPPASQVVVTGGAVSSGVRASADPQTGSFRVDIPLVAGQSNWLQFTVETTSGPIGQPVQREVAHRYECN